MCTQECGTSSSTSSSSWDGPSASFDLHEERLLLLPSAATAARRAGGDGDGDGGQLGFKDVYEDLVLDV